LIIVNKPIWWRHNYIKIKSICGYTFQ